MKNIFQNSRGMNIVGQGGKIILFTLPSLLAALAVHFYWPQAAGLPAGFRFLIPAGYVLLAPGLLLWAAAVVQLLLGFPKGQLVHTGAYGVVRNPIYASVALLILPGVALLTQTWVYPVVSVFLIAGVMIFIPTEERALRKTFGDEYAAYCKRVHRLIPFVKPRAS